MAILKEFAARKGITIPLLSDSGSQIIRAFHLLNESVPKDSGVYGIPHPMTILVDASGKVRSKHVESDIRDRYTAANVLRLRAREETRRTKRLTILAGQSNATVRPGERIRLSLDVRLQPGLHVYAPGVKGYIPIEWKLTPSSLYVPHDPVLPPSRVVRLPAIGESVPAYEGKFTLEREVTIAQEKTLIGALPRGLGEIAIEGSFRYQACDERECFIPETVPLRWVFRVLPHDPTRSPEGLQHKLGR